ncbi:MAG: hypothetical protein PHQ47_03425 [Candidatus Portnoybacteria bacterium]|nr:hypothetical protein [Candidatus Portnoybacteria bacterium]
MPGLITHLACAERYLGQNPKKDYKKFILGTVFPDIKYLAHLERDLTHKKYKAALNLSRFDSFKSGWKFHIYIDSQWNKVIRKSPLFENYYKDDKILSSVAAKFIADKADKKRILEFGRILEILKKPNRLNVAGVPEEKMKLYYSVSADYFATLNIKNYLKFVFPRDSIVALMGKMAELKKDKELNAFLARIIDRIMP